LKQAPKTILFWSAKNEEDLIESRLFARMKQECPWFSFMPTLTQENSSRYGHGRITPELLTGAIGSENLAGADYYLCGPLPMIRRLQQFLKSNSVPQRNIHSELFSF
jgi:NAD(P)H-flavin reductase